MANNLQVPLTIHPKPDPTKEEQQVEEEASLLARRMANAAAFPMVLKAPLELGVIDITAIFGYAPVLLDRMLRFLASYSVFKCRTVVLEDNGQTDKIERVFAAEPVCKFLLNNSDVSGSFASLCMVDLSDVYIKTWRHLKDMILEGRDAFSYAHGMKIFEYIQTDSQFGEVFNKAMLESSTIVMKKVLNVYEGFKDVKTLVDVGGGLGNTLSLITSNYPHIVGVNFDLPSVLASAPSYRGTNHICIINMYKKIRKLAVLGEFRKTSIPIQI
ncbi:hypothetical protein EUTSA_v10015575mg [Eutrema salsugineum]|uniref:Uncharacterized protein n=1 Tax=Eutrema salsugineum TaxID=72664 RepID=V4LTB5_EUTSA|nr:hypothetical protein EUTSA_v10015575mg [Eutrema salsugineum]